jgi:hypothetical protein
MEENAMKSLKSLLFFFIVILILSVSMGISPTVSPSYASRVNSNDWTYTGNLSDAHFQGTATLLQNGKVLVAGGRGISDVTASAELYDPETGVWSPTGAMNTARHVHSATLLPDGRVLVAGGGYPNGQVFSSAELYDPATGTWSFTGSMNQARETHSALLLRNGKVLVAGGNDGTSSELYDPAAGTWSYTGSLNISRGSFAAALFADGKVLVAGGYHGAGATESAELYDPFKGTWSLTGSMNESRAWHTANLLPDGKVLIAGSEIYGNVLSTAEIFDPATGTWSYTGSMQDSRGNHTAVSLPDGTVLVASGWGTNSKSAELYNPGTGTWSYTGSMNDGRGWPTGTFLPDGKVLVTGGEGITTTELYNFPLSVNLVPPEQIRSARRGDTLQFVETLSNNTGITDTFNIELGESLWPATLSDSILGPLGNGQQITFTVGVSVPLDADWGFLNSVLITATSSVSPTVYFDTAVLRSQMGLPPDVYMPMALQSFYKCYDFFDDFSDPSSGWWTGETDTGQIEYTGGEYRVLVKPKNHYWMLGSPACEREKYSVEVDARWAGNSGSSYGLVFGIKGDWEQLYTFEVNSDYQMYTLYRRDAAGWTELVPWTSAPVINSGAQVNHLKATRNGDLITLEVNGTILGTWSDSTVAGDSGAGVIVSSYSDLANADAAFDNFKVTGLGSSAAAGAAGLEANIQQPVQNIKVHREGSQR